MKQLLVIVAAAAGLAILASACQPTTTVPQAESAFCQSLAAYSQSLQGVAAINSTTTVDEAKAAVSTVETANQAMVAAAKTMGQVKVDNIETAWANIGQTVNSVSGSATLGQAAASIQQSVAGVQAAIDEVGSGAGCAKMSVMGTPTP
jgi:hypothetical protein